jgi:Holliday junction resolvase-like predicted endonuclease
VKSRSGTLWRDKRKDIKATKHEKLEETLAMWIEQ